MSLNSIIGSAANSLSVFETAINTVQQNVTNASVPNYTALTPNLATSATGVTIDGISDARNLYAEHAVWSANAQLGAATTQSSNLSILQSQFDVSGSGGIPGALSNVYSAFSAWGTNPSDPTARNQVIQAAQQVASAFNSASTALQSSSQEVTQQIQNAVDSIDSLGSDIADLNGKIQANGESNPTLQAQLYAKLEALSQYTSVSVQVEANGTATVLINGQTPLVTGQSLAKLSVGYPDSSTITNPGAPAHAVITNANGDDITAIASQGGQLAGLLKVRNQTIPSLLGDQNQQGSLNQLAQGFADRVNALLETGSDGTNTGKAIFAYTSGKPTAVAATLAVDPSFTSSDLVAEANGVANSVPNQLAALSNSTNSADQIKGHTYTDFYSNFTAELGSAASAASDAKSNLTDQQTQAQNLRSDLSGVSINEQAALLMQYQQAYAASSQLISVVNSLTSDLMNMIQP